MSKLRKFHGRLPLSNYWDYNSEAQEPVILRLVCKLLELWSQNLNSKLSWIKSSEQEHTPFSKNWRTWSCTTSRQFSSASSLFLVPQPDKIPVKLNINQTVLVVGRVILDRPTSTTSTLMCVFLLFLLVLLRVCMLLLLLLFANLDATQMLPRWWPTASTSFCRIG